MVASGLEGICVTRTRLSRVDGQKGRLVIGGFPVEEIAPQARFEDVLHLLWFDRLPLPDESESLRRSLASERVLPAATLALLRAAAERATPHMDALRMAVASLSLAEDHPGDSSRAAQLHRAQALVARFPTIVAAYARLRRGFEPVAPDATLPHAANYLYMLTGERPDVDLVRALETYLNTVVDHGMNASTFTARVIISTRSDIVSALTGAIGALKGPLHGGAPGPALDMVFAIRDRAARSGHSLVDETESWVREKLVAGERIMGFGHRVYKVRDPRAEVLGAAAARLFEGVGDRELYGIVRRVEQVVVRVLHEHKPQRRLETNVEFYTALLLHGIGLDSDLFTPTFAIGRAGGWTAHVLEQIDEDRLIRPDAIYVGEDRHWNAA
ncbi:MAG: citrate synthase/methylcitrate synthase [Deltaproteobacteria bacterium]|nr:citrate synthase/methylcitrate synthase [Deltaproteobacteria bacterium]